MLKMNYFNSLAKFFCKQSKVFHSRISVHRKLLVRNCSTRRTLFYVPGNDTHKLKKALGLEVDCIAMDCEDGVAVNQKEVARNTIKEFLDEGPVTKSCPEWSVRINAVQFPDLCTADLEVLLSAKNLPASICLPKVNSVDELQWFAEKVWNMLIKRPENDRGPLKLIMYIESPLAVMTLPELCKKAQDLSTMAPIIPVALVFGSDDLLANLGATRTETGVELFYARQKIVLVAKAFGLQAIDMVCLYYKQLERFEKECVEGFLMGYTGKQVIHPAQIPVAQEAFVPSRSKINWAKKVIEAFNKKQEEGQGAFTFENAMIDMPTIKQAENILEVARTAGKLKHVCSSDGEPTALELDMDLLQTIAPPLRIGQDKDGTFLVPPCLKNISFMGIFIVFFITFTSDIDSWL